MRHMVWTTDSQGRHRFVAPARVLPLTQPIQMGWSSWNAFHSGQLELDEATIRRQADALVSSGMRDAGYTFINIGAPCPNLYNSLTCTILQTTSGRLGVTKMARYSNQRRFPLVCVRWPIMCTPRFTQPHLASSARGTGFGRSGRGLTYSHVVVPHRSRCRN